MRRTRAGLRKRAERNVDTYETPTHRLPKAPARFRVVLAWLNGYEAARRDLQREQLALQRELPENGMQHTAGGPYG